MCEEFSFEDVTAADANAKSGADHTVSQYMRN